MFHLIWKDSTGLLRNWTTNGMLAMPPVVPGSVTDPSSIELSTSAMALGTLERLENLRLYLTGNPDDVKTVLSVWPFLGRKAGQPRRDELNGGLETSFDGGRTWRRFKYAADNTDPDYPNYGWEAAALATDPAGWATVPGMAVGLNGQDGVLGPFDTARFLLRWRIPSGADQFHVFGITLEAAYDVV